MPNYVKLTKYHQVTAGETFSKIATLTGIDIHRLMAVNTGRGERGARPNFEARTPPYWLDVGDSVGIPDHEEVSAIAGFMAAEMNANSMGFDARRLQQMNWEANTVCPTSSILEILQLNTCIENKLTYAQAALIQWGWQVRQDGPWDHKPVIAKKFIRRENLSGVQQDHLYVAADFSEYAVFYDIWSNFHYGYVGIACGFTESTLLNGAGLEQIGTDLWRLSWPRRNGVASGLEAFDNQKDRASIKAGMALYYKKPQNISQKDVLDLMLSDPSFKRPRGSKNV